MYFENVFKALNKANVQYVVAGGTAVVLHGYRRFTDDLDLIVLLEEKNLDKFFDVLISVGYMPKVPVTKEQFKNAKQRAKWKKEKGMIVFSFCERNPPFKLVDMFIDEPIPFKDLYKNRVIAKVNDINVPLISINHLTKLKRKASRAVDLVDIVQLDAIKKSKN